MYSIIKNNYNETHLHFSIKEILEKIIISKKIKR